MLKAKMKVNNMRKNLSYLIALSVLLILGLVVNIA